jgi:glutathione synthase/RimK-type ligase-like ATP-grasp enzyme
MPVDCIVATCELVPRLDPDDRMLVTELRKRGVSVSIAVWNDPRVDWGAAALCLVRSTWDYHRRYDEFLTWIERIASLTVVKNDPQLLRWNAHKSYLRDLERRGVPVVPTLWLERGARASLREIAQAHGWRSLVLKPARGAASHGVTLVREDAASLANGEACLEELLARDDVLVQPYLEAVVTYGERALIFLHGRYSHAAVKKPFDRILAVSSGPSSYARATSDEIEIAARAVAAVGGTPLYARVDLLKDDDGGVRVSELELIEPTLYFALHEPARRELASAVERELELAANPRRSEGVPVVSCRDAAQ